MAWCSLLDSRGNAIPFVVGAIGLCLATGDVGRGVPELPYLSYGGGAGVRTGLLDDAARGVGAVPVFVLLVTYLHRLGRP